MEIFKILWDPLINLKEKRKGVHVLPIRIYYNERGVKRVQRGLLIENDIITIGDSIKDLFPEIAQFKVISLFFFFINKLYFKKRWSVMGLYCLTKPLLNIYMRISFIMMGLFILY